MSLDTLWQVIYGLSGGLILCLILIIWPQTKQKNRSRDNQLPVFAQRLGPVLLQVILFIADIGGATFFLQTRYQFTLPLAAGLSTMGLALIYPMIQDAREKSFHQKLRQEGIAIAEYVAGRMSSNATLYESLNELHEEVLAGVRQLPLCHPDLEVMIVNIRLGKSFQDELLELAAKYTAYPRFAQIWEAYALVVDLGLGAEAAAMQTEDVSQTQELMDELIHVLETELSTAVATRWVMFLLIGGMSIYLMFFSVLGDSLTDTLAGNVIIGLTLGGILLSQTIGRHLEKMPMLEF